MIGDCRPVAVDLFSGVGGMSLGFEQAGFNVAAAVEIDPVHAAAHKYNFPGTAVVPRSVVGLAAREIRSLCVPGARGVDVVFGGAPCQGFSLAACVRRSAQRSREGIRAPRRGTGCALLRVRERQGFDGRPASAFSGRTDRNVRRSRLPDPVAVARAQRRALRRAPGTPVPDRRETRRRPSRIPESDDPAGRNRRRRLAAGAVLRRRAGRSSRGGRLCGIAGRRCSPHRELGNPVGFRQGPAVPRQRRMGVRPSATLGSRRTDCERPHEAHRNFPQTFLGDRPRNRGADFAVLPPAGRRRTL